MDYSKLIDIGSKVSLAVVLMIILWTGSTGYWVFGAQYKEALAERDTWKDLALKGVKVSEQAALRATPITGPMAAKPPLPTDASPQQVDQRLDALRRQTAYPSEPNAEPVEK